MSGIFINYRGADSDTAAALIARELAARFGRSSVFLDCLSIPAGSDFVDELLGRLQTCSVLIVVIGSRWLTLTDAVGRRCIDDPSDWIRREIVVAFACGLRVIPVLTDNATLPTEADLPADIAALCRRQYVPLRRRYPTVDLDYLVARIIEAEPDLGRREEGPVAQRLVPTQARHLLPMPAHLAGRADELAELDRFLAVARNRRSPGLVVLTGFGGVGKTALALYWLHRNAELFPDGQLYADLGAFSATGPVSPGAVLFRFLRALGVPGDEIPHEVADQAALYRSITANRALAVLADDASSTGQVQPLLTAAERGLLVVTSRRHLAGLMLHGAETLAVPALDMASSIDLLAELAGRDRVERESEQAARLAELCGGAPLALRLAAARLSGRPHRSIFRLVQQLANERKRLAMLIVDGAPSLQAGFELSYSDLSTGAARLYRYLGLHPGAEFGADIAAHALAAARQDVDGLLEELSDASMLTEVGDERYRFHDLLRLHARQQADLYNSAADRVGAVNRMVTWYLDTAVAADLRVTPLRRRYGRSYRKVDGRPACFADAAAALAWLERELPNLLAAQRAAVEHEWYEQAWQFGEALWGFFLYRKHFTDWTAVHKLALNAAHRCGDLVAEARMNIYLGYAHLNLEKFDTAARRFTKALELSRAARHPATESTALEHLGLVARGTGHADEALDYFRQATSVAVTLTDRRSTALNLRRIGEILHDMGRYHDAVEQLTRVVVIATELGDNVLRARALTSLGSAHLRLERSSEAARELREAVVVLSASGADYYHAEALEAMASLLIHAGDKHSARAHLQQSLALYTRAGGPRVERARNRLSHIDMASDGRAS